MPLVAFAMRGIFIFTAGKKKKRFCIVGEVVYFPLSYAIEK